MPATTQHLIERRKQPALLELINTICIYLEGIRAVAGYDEPASPGGSMVLESARGGFQVRLPNHGLIAAAMAEIKPDGIEVTIEPKKQTRAYARQSAGFISSVDTLARAIFLEFYVGGAARLEARFGGRKSTAKWPGSWRFAWVLRNALAHDGVLNFKDPSMPPVEWDGIAFSPGDDGRPAFDGLNIADIVALLIDMDRELREALDTMTLTLPAGAALVTPVAALQID